MADWGIKSVEHNTTGQHVDELDGDAGSLEQKKKKKNNYP